MNNRELANLLSQAKILSNKEWHFITTFNNTIKNDDISHIIQKILSNQARIEILKLHFE